MLSLKRPPLKLMIKRILQRLEAVVGKILSRLNLTVGGSVVLDVTCGGCDEYVRLVITCHFERCHCDSTREVACRESSLFRVHIGTHDRFE